MIHMTIILLFNEVYIGRGDPGGCSRMTFIPCKREVHFENRLFSKAVYIVYIKSYN